MYASRRSVLAAGSAAVAMGAAAGALATFRPKRAATLPTAVPDLLREMNPPPHLRFIAMELTHNPHGSRRAALRELVSAIPKTRNGNGRSGLALSSTLFAPGASRPHQLAPMPSFAGDVLDPAQTQGDVLVQISGRTAAELNSAAQQLVSSTPGWRLLWHIDGFRSQSRVEDGRALTSNPFHFHEGFGNPSNERGAADRALVRADQGEPGWAVGGSYQVVRIIRLATELWDKDSIHEQERIVGRRRNGRWLDGTPALEEPNFAADLAGKLTPLDSHVRLAAPDRRNLPPLVRRSYSYDRGNGDVGLIFSCFQRDLAAGFEAVQKRLAGEAMAKYLLTTGGGYFFVPPPGDAWVEALLAA